MSTAPDAVPHHANGHPRGQAIGSEANAPTGNPVTVDILEGDGGLESLADDWDRLFEQLPEAQPYLHRAWVSAWHRVAPRRAVSQFIAVRKHGLLTGVFPLSVSRRGPLRIARPLGTGLPSYLGVLADAQDDETIKALADACASGRVCDLLIMHDVYSRDAGTNAFLARLDDDRARTHRQHRARVHLIRLAPTFDEYLQAHSSKSRQTLRRKQRKLESSHDVRVELLEGTSLDQRTIARIAQIQSVSWMHRRGADVFAKSFYRQLIEDMAQAGLARAWILSVDGSDAAFVLSLCSGDSLIYKWTAFTLEHAELSVGQVLTAITIRESCAKGIRWYDFSHGDAAYKSFWSTDFADIARVAVGVGVVGRLAVRVLATLWCMHQTPAIRAALRKLRSARRRFVRVRS